MSRKNLQLYELNVTYVYAVPICIMIEYHHDSRRSSSRLLLSQPTPPPHTINNRSDLNALEKIFAKSRFRTKGSGKWIPPRDLWRGEATQVGVERLPDPRSVGPGVGRLKEEKQKETQQTTYTVVPLTGCSGARGTTLW